MGAELNAFTSKEYTAYYSRFVDEHLEQAFDMLADMVVQRQSRRPELRVASARSSSKRSRAWRTRPTTTSTRSSATRCGRTTPSACRSSASRETVGGFDHAQSVAFRARHYLTGNCVVAAAGNVDHDELVALAETKLAEPAARPALGAAGRARGEPLAPRRCCEKETEQAHICFGVSTMNAHHPDRFALSLVDGVLGGGMASRLFQEIREKRGLAYAVYSFSALYQDTGRVRGLRRHAPVQRRGGRRAHPAPRSSGSRATASRPRSSTACARRPPGTSCSGMESTRNRMTRLGKNEVTGGEILSADEIMERFNAVTMDDIKRVSAEVLSAEKVLAVIGPFTAEKLEHLLAATRRVATVTEGGHHHDSSSRRRRCRQGGQRSRARRHGGRRHGGRRRASIRAPRDCARDRHGRRRRIECRSRPRRASSPSASPTSWSTSRTRPSSRATCASRWPLGVDCVVGTTGLSRGEARRARRARARRARRCSSRPTSRSAPCS